MLGLRTEAVGRDVVAVPQRLASYETALLRSFITATRPPPSHSRHPQSPCWRGRATTRHEPPHQAPTPPDKGVQRIRYCYEYQLAGVGLESAGYARHLISRHVRWGCTLSVTAVSPPILHGWQPRESAVRVHAAPARALLSGSPTHHFPRAWGFGDGVSVPRHVESARGASLRGPTCTQCWGCGPKQSDVTSSRFRNDLPVTKLLC